MIWCFACSVCLRLFVGLFVVLALYVGYSAIHLGLLLWERFA